MHNHMLIQPRDTLSESLLVIGSIPNLEGCGGSRVPLVLALFTDTVFLLMNIFDEVSISSKANNKTEKKTLSLFCRTSRFTLDLR